MWLAGCPGARRDEAQANLGLPDLDAPLAVGDAEPALDEATRERLRALGQPK